MSEKLSEYKNKKLVFNTSGKIIQGQKTVKEIHLETVKLIDEIDNWLTHENSRPAARNS